MSRRIEDDEDYGDDYLDDEYDDAGDADMAPPLEVPRVPEDQVKNLTKEDLEEPVEVRLVATDPNVSRSVTRFNFETREFVTEPTLDHLAVHFSMDGTLVHKASDEAVEQSRVAEAQAAEDRAERSEMGVGPDDEDAGDEKEEIKTAADGSSVQTHSMGTSMEDDEDGEDVDHSKLAEHALKNQFNFSERASQTFNNPMRDRQVATEPPPTADYGANVTAWDIIDTYVADLERQAAARAHKEAKSSRVGGRADKDEKQQQSLEDTVVARKAPNEELFCSKAMADALKGMERLVNANAEAECFSCYKYYEDKSEHNRPDGRGQFIPLWRFAYEKARYKKTVTSITWNPKFTDLFAVGYGSYDFMKQTTGLIACYSLKNTSYPEYIFTAESGIMCLAWHPQHPALLAAGMYDGSVAVYNVRSGTNKPLYVSSDPKVKHTDPVWQVSWNSEDVGKNINFFSISGDGRVTDWIISKNELVNEEVVELKISTPGDDAGVGGAGAGAADPAELPAMVGLAGGTCFDFNQTHEHLFVVGTEEGALHEYSKADNSQNLKSYQGHNMAVYTVKWNSFHPGVFITCSADWTVKVWEHTCSRPVMTFDLNTSVGDVAWAPYSSTVFAVVTTDGRLRLYDISVSKHEPIGEYERPGSKKQSKYTHLAFSPSEPIICVGDDQGVVNVFKLTANLHKMSAPQLEDVEPAEEVEKLDKLLIIPDKIEKEQQKIMAAAVAIQTATQKHEKKV